MTPELKILVINAVIMGIAYFGIYPSRGITHVRQMVMTDLALTGLSLLAAGGLYWGSGVQFSLILFTTNWAVFAVLTLALMEIPLFIWFCRKNGIDMSGGNE